MSKWYNSNAWLIAIGAALILPFLLWNAAVDAVAVNGKWTPWSAVTTVCSKSCGGGKRKVVRTCTNPVPQDGGRQCQDSNFVASSVEEKLVDCNTESCWWHDQVWEEWSECSEVCGMGFMTRKPNCSVPGGCGTPTPPIQNVTCNTWNRTTCPSPCDTHECMSMAVCNDVSDDIGPKVKCECIMDYKMENGVCKRPPPTPPTERPIPTLPAEQKVVATVLSKTASSVLIFFVTLTLILFLILRVFTTDRVIQMNMEIALLAGHLFLLFPPSLTSSPTICKIISILLHFTFLACFNFMMLEAVHMYTMVAHVVKTDGLFTKVQNLIIGWGVPAAIVGLSVAFEWNNYGGEYHCWLQLNKPVMVAQQLPIIALMIMTFTLIEAAGEADDYKPLRGTVHKQVMSAKFSQRTNLLIVPFVYAHWVLGTLAEYQQNMALYGIFSIVNGWLGACVFFFHCSNNEQVRAKLSSLFKNMRSD